MSGEISRIGAHLDLRIVQSQCDFAVNDLTTINYPEIEGGLTCMQSEGFTTLTGMPQLSYGGLSENWLLKECGDRHWWNLAGQLGFANPNFHDALGNRLYAAFTAVRSLKSTHDTVSPQLPKTLVSKR